MRPDNSIIKNSVCKAFAIAIVSHLFTSCADDTFADDGNFAGSAANVVMFDVSSGDTGGGSRKQPSRSGSDIVNDNGITELDPMALPLPGRTDTLYFHRYVADETTRVTGARVASGDVSRSTPVNDMDDFYTVNGKDGFGVMAERVSDRSVFIPSMRAIPFQGTYIWKTDGRSYYWPDEEQLRFHAFAPYKAAGLLEGLRQSDGVIEFDYKVPVSDNGADAEVQPDLMFASSECRKSTSVSGKAPLNFRHALSAIKFAVRDVANGEIVSISLNGVYSDGHCVYTADDSGDGPFEWTDLSGASSFTQKFNFKTVDVYPSAPQETVINSSMPEKTFMLIPQEIPVSATIGVVFRNTDGSERTLSAPLACEEIPEWEPGKEYVYTLSTSSFNWTYVFDVTGSNQVVNDEKPKDGKFSDARGIIEINQTVTEGAYYHVKSYRVRANNPSHIENVPWTAVTSDGVTVIPAGQGLDKYQQSLASDLNLSTERWMPTVTLKGDGSTSYVKYPIVFAPQRVGTNWDGDWQMYQNSIRGSKSNPVDLSRINGTQSTANCYVVNSGGYYKFPLVFGNAITNGLPNEKAYKPNLNGQSESITFDPTTKSPYEYKALTNFKDYKGNKILKPQIEGAESAQLVWEDAYNLIDSVMLDTSANYVSFKVVRENIQQGNAVISIKDAAGAVMWSWHIWVNEEWVNDNGTVGKGDVNCQAYSSSYSNFTVAPYNIGWCDAKNVWYLKRQGTMTFTQAGPKKNTAVLNVLQREHKIEYWIGNNVYYQFGRKDPFVGFMNYTSTVKYNFGNDEYSMQAQPTDIESGIRKPHVMFVGAEASEDGKVSPSNDWLSISYFNLWNNYFPSAKWSTKGDANITDEYAMSSIKTVYDPSPAGYCVPPIDFFRVFTKGTTSASNQANSQFSSYFYGSYNPIGTQEITFQSGNNIDKSVKSFNEFYGNTKRNGTGQNLVKFNATGHRWYAKSSTSPYKPGDNFNPQFVYLWGNITSMRKDQSAFCLALGEDPVGKMYIQSRFWGRRAMSRPVRCVRER